MTDRLTTTDLFALSYILGSLGKRVRYLPHPDGDVVEGVARHLVKDPKSAGFLTDTDDVRDAYLRVSGTFEHFIPVREVVGMYLNDVYRADA